MAKREAIKLAVKSKVMVITGGPGVGKTTLVKVLLGEIAPEQDRRPVAGGGALSLPRGSVDSPRPCLM